MSKAKQQAQEQPKPEQPVPADKPPATTTPTVAVEPANSHFLGIPDWLIPDWITVVMFFAFIVGIVIIFRGAKANEKIYNSKLAEKDKELEGKQRDIKLLEKNLNNTNLEWQGTTRALELAQNQISMMDVENKYHTERISSLEKGKISLSQQARDLKESNEQITEQSKAHAEELSDAYEKFKVDLTAARHDEVEQIRQKYELVVRQIQHEAALKEREHSQKLLQVSVELEETTKLVKEKNPTVHTAIQKELKSRVHARLEAANRKDGKREQQQLNNNGKKMIASAEQES